MKKITHQNGLNYLTDSNKNKPGIDLIRNSLSEINVKTTVSGLENVPQNWKVIFAANHQIVSIDGLILINEVYKKYGKVKAIVNDLLNNVESLNEFFIVVNKHGITSKEYVKILNETFRFDIPVGFFPAGLAPRRKKGVIKDLELEKTFITRAVKCKRNIIPVYIDGILSIFFIICRTPEPDWE